MVKSCDELINCWLDCDPGTDDAFAIVMALFNPKLKLLGISSVAGNQTIDKTTTNVLHVLNMLGQIDKDKFTNGISLPVIKGATKPFVRTLVTSSHVYGETGLNTNSNRQYPVIPQFALDQVFNADSYDDAHFTTKIYRHFKSSPRPVTLIAVGPLTNVALLLLNHPDVVDHIDKIVFMGGSLGQGNTGTMSEFNIHVDPEVAAIVLDHAAKKLVRVVMVPLETTHQALVTPKIMQRIKSFNSPLSDYFEDMLLFMAVMAKEDPPLHDPCAVAFVIDESLFKHKLMRVDVELSNPLTAGQTICDVNNYQNRDENEKNVVVTLGLDRDRFWSLMLDSIEQAVANLNEN